MASRAPVFVRVAMTAAIGLFAASCVLLVSPATFGDRCSFEGEDTDCGRCLRDRCQSAVDDCCKDDACTMALSALDGCALHGDATCDALATHEGSSGKDGALARCASRSCGSVCRSFPGTSDTQCNEPTLGSGSGCACKSAPSSGNDFECSAQTYAGTVCCAPDGWPAPGLACTCLAFGCTPQSPGCYCRLTETLPSQPDCTATSCCVSSVDPDKCQCGRECFELERRVSSCSLSSKAPDGSPVIGCRKGQHRVASCSIRSSAGP